jgi:dTDP-4-amino-4,6-dideoxygalactose transaminase
MIDWMPPVCSLLFPEFPPEDQRHHHEALMQALQRVLLSGRFVLADEVRTFETEFAEFLGSGQVVGTGSGTDAIELLLRADGIGHGDGVIVPTLAPSAVAAAVMRTGATIVLCDVDEETLTLCPVALGGLIDRHPRLRAVIAVHLYGHPCRWDCLAAVCGANRLALIEDASQAHGATWEGRTVGSLGRASVWSFYPTKNLAALGDAGAIWTNDAELAEKLRWYREYGWRHRHLSDFPGINSRLDEIQAAVLRVKLPSLAGQVRRRRELASRYRASLTGVRLPPEGPECGHAYHQFVVRTRERNPLQDHLRRRGIPAAVHYPAALHQQPAFACRELFPVAERAVSEVLSLPFHPYLGEEAIEAVISAVADFES